MRLTTFLCVCLFGSVANAAPMPSSDLVRRTPHRREESEECNRIWAAKDRDVLNTLNDLDGCPPPAKDEKKGKEPGARVTWIDLPKEQIGAARVGLAQDEANRKEQEKEHLKNQDNDIKEKEEEEQKLLAKEEKKRKKSEEKTMKQVEKQKQDFKDKIEEEKKLLAEEAKNIKHKEGHERKKIEKVDKDWNNKYEKGKKQEEKEHNRRKKKEEEEKKKHLTKVAEEINGKAEEGGKELLAKEANMGKR